MKKPLVIAGFAGVGKTTLAKKYNNVLDLESTIYKWDNTGFEHLTDEQKKGNKDRKENPDWPGNYIEALKKGMEEYDIVLVWISSESLELYKANGIEYTICYASKECKEIYRQRFKDRNNRVSYQENVSKAIERDEEKYDNMDCPKIKLKGNETLEDYLLENNFYLKPRRKCNIL